MTIKLLIKKLISKSRDYLEIQDIEKIQKAFETVGFAKIATSADEAKHLGYLKKDDTVILNRTYQIQAAKNKAIELADGYNPPTYRDDLKLPGVGGRTAMAMALKGFKMQGKISEHDMKIGKHFSQLPQRGINYRAIFVAPNTYNANFSINHRYRVERSGYRKIT